MSNNELETTLDEQEAIVEEVNEIDPLDEPYRPVGQLHIPEEAVNLYKEKGFDLHWVRIHVPSSNGELDFKNIQKKEADLYEFVPRQEIPGLKRTMTSYFGDDVLKGEHGLYVVGELALAKIPHRRIQSKRRYIDQRTQSRSTAIVNDLRKNNLMPDANRGEGWKVEHGNSKGNDTSFG